MPNEFKTIPAIDAVPREQIKAFFAETQAQNVAGIVVLTGIVWLSSSLVPAWTWWPGLLLSCVMTLVRGVLIMQYQRQPQQRSTAQWGRGQTVCAAINGLAWGYVTSMMCHHLPLANQFMVLTVAAISASAAATEGFAYYRPSLAFISFSQLPLAFWFLFSEGENHTTLGILLVIFVLVLSWQLVRRHAAFNESLALRFKNERLAHELAGQEQIAIEAGMAKSRFLAAASHDLRQPVQAVSLFVELMRPEMRLTEKGEAYFGKVKYALRTVSEMLGTLLDLSRLDASTVEPEIEVISVNELFRELIREFAPLTERKGLALRVMPTRCHVASDPVLLGRILRNLMSNALRYTPSGKVLLGCRRRGSRVLIQVWDTGIGISKQNQEAIFGEFFQVGNQHRDREKGLGLGLSIVDRAARLLNAPLTLNSRIGKGSCFSLSLPLAPVLSDAERAMNAARAQSQPYDLSGRCIVLVENEALIRNGLHELIENWGALVISGATFAEVAAALAAHDGKVDAIVSDFGIAENESGLQVVARLREQLGSQVPALIISGDTSPETRNLISDNGLSLLLKPVRPWKLRQGICALFPRSANPGN